MFFFSPWDEFMNILHPLIVLLPSNWGHLPRHTGTDSAWHSILSKCFQELFHETNSDLKLGLRGMNKFCLFGLVWFLSIPIQEISYWLFTINPIAAKYVYGDTFLWWFE